MNILFLSKILRDNILKEKEMFDKLKDFFWDKEFISYLSTINIDETIEPDLSDYTLYDVYTLGLNFGKCGLTSRYLIRLFDSLNKGKISGAPILHMGTCELLKGTKNSPNGEHVWVEFDNNFYCPTLMLKIPVNVALENGYTINKTLAYDCARILSEYDTYSNILNKFLSTISK